jgi:hypothetical protein
MGPHRLLAALVFSLLPATAFADKTEWRKYVIPTTGANVDIPVNIFTEDAGPPEGGTGRRFFTKNHRADLTVQSTAFRPMAVSQSIAAAVRLCTFCLHAARCASDRRRAPWQRSPSAVGRSRPAVQLR